MNVYVEYEKNYSKEKNNQLTKKCQLNYTQI